MEAERTRFNGRKGLGATVKVPETDPPVDTMSDENVKVVAWANMGILIRTVEKITARTNFLTDKFTIVMSNFFQVVNADEEGRPALS